MSDAIVVRVEFGSHLYGTNTPSSDHDYKSVYVPSASDILLQRVKGSLGHKVKRLEGDKNSPDDTDDEMYSLQRFLGLLSEGQTVTIDMLFTPKPLITSALWDEIHANKDCLLTKRSAAFVGYCRTQANKYGIKGSRVAAAKDAAEFFKAHCDRLGTTAKLREIAELLSSIVGEHTKIVELETTPGNTECWYIEYTVREFCGAGADRNERGPGRQDPEGRRPADGEPTERPQARRMLPALAVLRSVGRHRRHYATCRRF